jgi:hypothetical protein
VMTSGLFFIEKLRPLEIHYTVAHLPGFNRGWLTNHGGRPEAHRPVLLLRRDRILTNSSYGASRYHRLFRRPWPNGGSVADRARTPGSPARSEREAR